MLLKRFKKLVLGILIVLAVFLFILINFPLPTAVTRMILTAKLDDLLPQCSVELDKSEFYFFKGLKAESLKVIRDKQAVLTLEKPQLSYRPSFIMITGTGQVKLISGPISVKRFSGDSAFLNFLSKVLGSSFENELVFKKFLFESDVNGRKITVNTLKATGEDLKIAATGYFEEKQKIDFTVDIFLSDNIIQDMSEGTRKLLVESQEDGFGRIRFEIYGLPQEPSFKIKTHFLEFSIS